MQQVKLELLSGSYGDVRLNEPLAPYTTWKIGGPADILLVPQSKEQLIQAVKLLHAHQTPWFVLGRGSNLLVSDKGVRGVVIKLGEALEKVRIEGERVYAGGAVSFIVLCQMVAREGLAGLEFGGGIPGTVGGAVYMNAGAHGSDVSRILSRAEVLLPTGELVTLQKDDFAYAYRHSMLHSEPGIVTEAVFQLKRGDRKEIVASLNAFKERRLQTQPLTLACAGSVFRNPEGHFSAKLIEDAGLKGLRVGGAVVSPMHANFIINTGQATAQDVLALIEQVQDTVNQKYGVRLVPEVMAVGER
ncbi:UDP-N-acetylmuramate dehydrogenase [Paenibacillus allorhizosphaerae]|uniref:UDP-N-acetylenolpyruvoylglucosamine reductase n=1 Tax=Paenibacillus allorhizosphaerae TaxID=2849866 RepID=A0ABN7TFX7_9BACL|nr:UDP-N-acetylmuramate dehydrogenase [Paenibacillus allorhizosphaerae]CAG7620839.1 UDP-N-acetylenolpyruvoylglucosamine reductase [Paenibacillus allorhizosphaerae]